MVVTPTATLCKHSNDIHNPKVFVLATDRRQSVAVCVIGGWLLWGLCAKQALHVQALAVQKLAPNISINYCEGHVIMIELCKVF